MAKCTWIISWVGQCKAEAGESGLCAEHAAKKCESCGAQATHDCEATGQFVCGASLCGDCEHATFPDGTNGGVGFNELPLPPELKGYHVKKTEQVFQPWYTRKEQ